MSRPHPPSPLDGWTYTAAETVLVVEYGEVEYAPGVFDPPTTAWNGPANGAKAWDFISLPNPEIDDKVGFVRAGQAVGGSSTVNGMYFDRPSRHDFEAWEQVNGAAEGEDKWDWDGVFPYFQKVRRGFSRTGSRELTCS